MTDDGLEWVSVREASRRLGRSPETIRRQIRDGTLEHPFEREPRAKGSSSDRFIVKLPRRTDDASPTPQDALPLYPDLRETVAALERQILAQEARHASERATVASEIREWMERAVRAEQHAEDIDRQLTRQQRVWWRKLREALLGY
jgi:hypothetical protein